MKYSVFLLLVIAFWSGRLMAMEGKLQDTQDNVADDAHGPTIIKIDAASVQGSSSSVENSELKKVRESLVAYFQQCLEANIKKISQACTKDLSACLQAIEEKASDNFRTMGLSSLFDLIDVAFCEMMEITKITTMSLSEKKEAIILKLKDLTEKIANQSFASPSLRSRVLNYPRKDDSSFLM